MLLNKETDYAIRIVSCLSKSEGHLPAAEISAKTGVTPRFTLKILHTLTVADVVRSFKGKNGGYFLSRSPEDITLLEIIEIFNGAMFVNHCQHESVCTNPGGICEFKTVFSQANDYLNDLFGKVTFKNEKGV